MLMLLLSFLGISRLAGRIAKWKKMCKEFGLFSIDYWYKSSKNLYSFKSKNQPFLSYHQAHTRVGAGVHIPTLVQAWWHLKNGWR